MSWVGQFSLIGFVYPEMSSWPVGLEKASFFSPFVFHARVMLNKLSRPGGKSNEITVIQESFPPTLGCSPIWARMTPSPSFHRFFSVFLTHPEGFSWQNLRTFQSFAGNTQTRWGLHTRVTGRKAAAVGKKHCCFPPHGCPPAQWVWEGAERSSAQMLLIACSLW